LEIRFYDVKRIECHKCNGVFNYYKGVSSKGKTSEFVIRIKSKVKVKGYIINMNFNYIIIQYE
jgi:hypothetical protein